MSIDIAIFAEVVGVFAITTTLYTYFKLYKKQQRVQLNEVILNFVLYAFFPIGLIYSFYLENRKSGNEIQ